VCLPLVVKMANLTSSFYDSHGIKSDSVRLNISQKDIKLQGNLD